MKIKGLLIGLALVGTLLFTPKQAEAATFETWQCSAFSDGAATVSYLINVTNLKTVEFYLVNNTDSPLYFAIVDNDWVVKYSATAQPHSNITMPCAINFQRLPHTDPDPDSIRYPVNTIFYARLG